MDNLDSDFIIQPFMNGIKLIRPEDKIDASKKLRGLSIRDVYAFPCNVYFMDRESKCVSLNELNCHACHCVSESEIIGRSLFDLNPPACAAEIVKNNLEVIKYNKKVIIDEIAIFDNADSRAFLSVKVPWYDENNQIIGLFGCSVNLIEHEVATSIAGMMQLSMLNQTPQLGRVLNYKDQLNSREEHILQLVVYGKTAREIGCILHLSKRTIEHYIESIKLKLAVSSKSELIEKTLLG